MNKIDEIEKLTQNNPWRTAILIKENGQLSYSSPDIDYEFKAASLIKLGIALYIAEKKNDTLNDFIYLKESEIVGGAGVINSLHIQKWHICDLIDLMLCLSDNTATNALLDYYDIDCINSFLQENFKGIQLKRYLMQKSSEENLTSVVAIMEVFERLLSTSNTTSKVIVRALAHQSVRNKLVAFSNPEFKTFNKTGELEQEQHDIARFEKDSKQIDCCVMTHFETFDEYQQIIKMMQKIGKLLTE